MVDEMRSAASREITGVCNRLERAAMGVVPARSQDEEPTLPLPAARGESPRPRRRGATSRKACLVAVWLVLALWLAWFKFGDDGMGAVASALLLLSPALVPVGFILYGSTASTTRRPVPRLPRKKSEWDTAPHDGIVSGQESPFCQRSNGP